MKLPFRLDRFFRDGTSRTDAFSWLAKVYAAIRETLADREERRRFLRNRWRWAVDNKLRLLISLVIAIFIYGFLHDRHPEDRTIDRLVGVKVKDAPKDVLIGVNPSTVTVTFKGTPTDLAGVDISSPSIVVQYPRRKRRGDQMVVRLRDNHVDYHGIRGFGQVSAIRFSPETVTLEKENEVIQRFEIELPKTKGKPENDGRVVELDYSPKEVSVKGGQRRLQGWLERGEKFRTELLDVEGKTERRHTAELSIQPPDDDTSGLQFLYSDSPNVTNLTPELKVRVTYRVERPRNNMPYGGIPVRLALPPGLSIPAGTTLEPTNVTVTLTGFREVFEQLSNNDIGVYAEVTPEALGEAFTNAVDVGLSIRVPSDRSIFSATAEPETVRLIPPPPAPEPEPPLSEPAEEAAMPEEETAAPAPAPTNAPPVLAPAVEAPTNALPAAAEFPAPAVEAPTNAPPAAPAVEAAADSAAAPTNAPPEATEIAAPHSPAPSEPSEPSRPSEPSQP